MKQERLEVNEKETENTIKTITAYLKLGKQNEQKKKLKSSNTEVMLEVTLRFVLNMIKLNHDHLNRSAIVHMQLISFTVF